MVLTSYSKVKWSSPKGGTVKLMVLTVPASYLQTVSNGQLLAQQSLYHLNPNPSSIRMSSYSNTVPDLLKSCLCVAPHHSLTKLRVV